MTFQEKKDNLIDGMIMAIRELVARHGVDSKDYSDKVLIPDERFMYQIEGYPNGKVVEVNDKLICSFGHRYDYTAIDIDELCELIDHLIDKYS